MSAQEADPHECRRTAWLASIREPALALDWRLSEWERVVRLARRLRLLARLAAGLSEGGLIDQVPIEARRHLVAQLRLSRWRTQTLVWTLGRVGAMLGDTPYPRVLLKGAAYIGQDLPISAGRLPSDLDLLVPHDHIADAVGRLEHAGWRERPLDEHDRRYYLEWSHEVPPMTHPLLSTELDLHHNILPPVARTTVDAGLLLDRLQPSKWPDWKVLHPTDQVLHSAAHLFLDAELRDRLRDLVDLDGLFRHFGAQPGFWPDLVDRAHTLGLTEPLALAFHFCGRWLGTSIPEDARRELAGTGPARRRRALLIPLLARVLLPTEPDERPGWPQGLCAAVLALRYHRQRMPLRLLLPHAWHKLNASRLQGTLGA